VISQTPVVCLPYVNSCGAGTFCDSGKVCINGTCMATAAGIAANANMTAQLPTNSIITPMQACTASRLTQRGCSSDSTPMLRANGVRLGYALVSDQTECFQSSAFKCCAIASTDPESPSIASLVSSCKGSVIFESAMSGIVNSTVSLFQSVAANAQAATAVAANASANGTVYNGTAIPGVEPVLQPVLQSLANLVTGVSQAILAPLNVTIGNGSRVAKAGTSKLTASPPPGSSDRSTFYATNSAPAPADSRLTLARALGVALVALGCWL